MFVQDAEWKCCVCAGRVASASWLQLRPVLLPRCTVGSHGEAQDMHAVRRHAGLPCAVPHHRHEPHRPYLRHNATCQARGDHFVAGHGGAECEDDRPRVCPRGGHARFPVPVVRHLTYDQLRRADCEASVSYVACSRPMPDAPTTPHWWASFSYSCVPF